MIRRRTFLAGAAAAAIPSALRRAAAGEAPADLYVPPPGVSSRNDLYLPGSPAPGLPAGPTLLADVDRMLAVEEGSGTAKIRILFEFTCPRSPELHVRIRHVLSKAKFDWIPVPSADAGADSPALALFAPGADAAALDAVFARRKPPGGVDAERAREQGRFFLATVGPELYRQTNRPFATPTLLYRGRDRETRIIRGAPDLGTLRAIAASAT